jgi:hypothetical protein
MAAHVAWWVWVAPVNAELGPLTGESLPADWTRLRNHLTVIRGKPLIQVPEPFLSPGGDPPRQRWQPILGPLQYHGPRPLEALTPLWYHEPIPRQEPSSLNRFRALMSRSISLKADTTTLPRLRLSRNTLNDSRHQKAGILLDLRIMLILLSLKSLILQRDFTRLTALGDSSLSMGDICSMVPPLPIAHQGQHPLEVKRSLGEPRAAAPGPGARLA